MGEQEEDSASGRRVSPGPRSSPTRTVQAYREVEVDTTREVVTTSGELGCLVSYFYVYIFKDPFTHKHSL